MLRPPVRSPMSSAASSSRIECANWSMVVGRLEAAGEGLGGGAQLLGVVV